MYLIYNQTIFNKTTVANNPIRTSLHTTETQIGMKRQVILCNNPLSEPTYIYFIPIPGYPFCAF